ncbi:hypothetical protein KIL84_005351 [Mauremys mutica]|uniref:Uncharacterized protein n=1 Tax=Mauremys mutica TaxID=74926 RepID=A0A9D3XM61_9SAUR|nr:hypothetical protein KIL84_005351 [Mauremys mutica]
MTCPKNTDSNGPMSSFLEREPCVSGCSRALQRDSQAELHFEDISIEQLLCCLMSSNSIRSQWQEWHFQRGNNNRSEGKKQFIRSAPSPLAKTSNQENFFRGVHITKTAMHLGANGHSIPTCCPEVGFFGYEA